VLFTFPSRYLFAIGRMRVLRLGGWSPHVQTGFHVSRLTRGPECFLPVRGYHPLWLRFPAKFPFLHSGHWPGPRSLATTNGVSFDVLSSRYLDVSVPWVSSLSGDLNGRVSPFGNPRIKAYSQLPEAYRSVLRPSSPACAKASTRCS
jgi:hypothetical protein